jgi:hypothetical protein
VVEPHPTISILDPGPKRFADLFVCILAAVAIGSYLINEMYEPDMWWHLAIGSDIIRNHAVPSVDRYTLAGLGQAYHDSHWLFQVALSLANRMAGMAGVEGVMVGIWSLTLLVTLKAVRKWVSLQVAASIVFFAAMASMERYLPRPELVTYLMLALFYLRLQEEKYRTSKDLILLAVLQVLWTNCHGLFVMGPSLVGAYWVVAVLRGPHGPGSDFRALGKVLASVIIASLISPFGVRGWEYALLLLAEVNPEAVAALKAVGELSPTFGAAARSAPAFWFFLVLLIATPVAVVVSATRGRASAERSAIGIAMAILAMTGRRNIVLFALVAAPLLAEHSWWLRDVLERKVRRAFLVLPPLLMAASAAYALSGQYYLKMEIPSRFGWGITPSYYPHGLPEFLRKTGFQGNIFNSNTLGGFYLFHSFPGGVPLTDGRWEIYDRKLLDTIKRGWVDPALLQRIIAQYDIRGFLLQHPSPESRFLLPFLSHDPRWRLVYYDQAASFWARSDLPKTPQATDLSGAQPSPSPSRIDDRIILDRFFKGTGAWQLRLRNLDRIAAGGSRGEHTLAQLGIEELQAGRLPEAEQIFLKLYCRAPKNLTALNELAFLAYRRGDRGTAMTYLRSALDAHPGDQITTANYNRMMVGQ